MSNSPTPHQQNLRKGRYSQHNQIYHVTATTLNRELIFNDFKTARILINILKTSDTLNQTITLAFVVMPDHIHWLFQLNQTKPLSKLVQSIKSIIAHQIGMPIWQPGYYDHALRKDEDIQTVARYIVDNPIRAGLVQKVADYPHWDAVWL